MASIAINGVLEALRITQIKAQIDASKKNDFDRRAAKYDTNTGTTLAQNKPIMIKCGKGPLHLKRPR